MASPFRLRKRVATLGRRVARSAFRAVFSGSGTDSGDSPSAAPTPAPSAPKPSPKATATAVSKASGSKAVASTAAKSETQPVVKAAPKKEAAKPEAPKRATAKKETPKKPAAKKAVPKKASAKKAKETPKAPAATPKAADKEVTAEELAEQRRLAHWEKTRLGVLGFVHEQGGRAGLRDMHDFSEKKYFIAHQSFSRLMEELTDGELLEFDFDSGMATLTTSGRELVG